MALCREPACPTCTEPTRMWFTSYFVFVYTHAQFGLLPRVYCSCSVSSRQNHRAAQPPPFMQNAANIDEIGELKLRVKKLEEVVAALQAVSESGRNESALYCVPALLLICRHLCFPLPSSWQVSLI